MHLKVVYADSWDFGQALSQRIKWASNGLSGQDFSILSKRAGEELATRVRGLSFENGEIPLHAIGLGAFEKYSCNRNADGFSERTLRATVDSFEKYAHYFKNHNNGPTDKRYGRIKLAFYNEPMSRVELIIGVYGTDKCARDHGGFVNEDVVNALEAGRDVAGSMACKLAYDVCSACNNKAKTRKDYCKSAEEGGTCTLFGCKTGLAKVASSGHIQHVDNPAEAGLRFFDYSHVGNPADYIAYGGVADYLSKSASEKRAVSGSELGAAYSLLPPLELCLTDCIRQVHRDQIKAAHDFARVEHQYADGMLLALGDSKQPELLLAGTKKEAAWASLANRGVLLSLPEFARQVGKADQVKQAATELPGVYSRLIADGILEHVVRSNPYTNIPAFSEALDSWAVKQASLYALTPAAAMKRAMTLDTTTPLTTVKVAAFNPDQENSQLTREYVSYKLAYYAGTAASLVLTPYSVIRQNYDCAI